MSDDLEAFLRQVAKNRAKRKQGSRTKPPIGKPAARPAPVRSSQRAAPPPVRAEVVSQAIEQADERFAKADGRFERDAVQLGRDVEQADDILESHMHATFDHRVGELDTEVEELASDLEPSAIPTGGAANVLARMLHDPKTVVQAILLSEVLQRPEHRW